MLCLLAQLLHRHPSLTFSPPPPSSRTSYCKGAAGPRSEPQREPQGARRPAAHAHQDLVQPQLVSSQQLVAPGQVLVDAENAVLPPCRHAPSPAISLALPPFTLPQCHVVSQLWLLGAGGAGGELAGYGYRWWLIAMAMQMRCVCMCGSVYSDNLPDRSWSHTCSSFPCSAAAGADSPPQGWRLREDGGYDFMCASPTRGQALRISQVCCGGATGGRHLAATKCRPAYAARLAYAAHLSAVLWCPSFARASLRLECIIACVLLHLPVMLPLLAVHLSGAGAGGG